MIEERNDHSGYGDFPKLQSPFVRKEINGAYICTPEIDPDFAWVFTDPTTKAVDKLDGTNIAVLVQDGTIKRVFNRGKEKFVFNIHQGRWEGACLEGIAYAIKKGWIKNDGLVFGEFVGEIINGNRHKINGHIFVPFDYLRDHCFWKSWSQNTYPKTYEAISKWFVDMPSLFNQRLLLPKIEAEGLVFTNAEGKMAKLRRDMFDWYKGARHGGI